VGYSALNGVLVFFLEWRLWRAGVERVYGNKRVVLRGYRWQYAAVAFSIGFVGFTGTFLGLMSYAGIQYPSLVCWLTGSFVVGGINLISVGIRLKYFDFSDNSVDS
jgi:hypothetical protein